MNQDLVTYDDIFKIPPFSMEEDEKNNFLTNNLINLTRHHIENCQQYANMMVASCYNSKRVKGYEEIPFLPVSLFKELDLLSVSKNQVFKTMMSSGTTGQAVSKIYLDKLTALNQQKALVKIVSDFIGGKRLPMLIIDSPSVLKDRFAFSARGAGILGFSIFGSNKTYALNDDMTINIEAVETFLQKHKGKPVLLFGFTFMVWQHFYKEIKEKQLKFDFSNGTLIHGGGWKKLISTSVDKGRFKRELSDTIGINRIHDYYGMVEQTGCIYMECENGHLHSSVFSDVLIRDFKDFSVCKIGQSGIIEVVSLLPQSYPGHVLLTEDEGRLLGIDDCPCGRKGKYFEVFGRIKNAEIRGCSDTYATKF